MKIPIKVEFFAGGLRPMTTLTLRSETLRLFGFVNAIIDTGSPTTILGGADIQRMLYEEKEVNLGGAQIKTRILPDAQLIISNKIKVKIPLQVPVKMIKGVPPPIIIGVDFLLEGKLKFFFDPAQREAYLETND